MKCPACQNSDRIVSSEDVWIKEFFGDLVCMARYDYECECGARWQVRRAWKLTEEIDHIEEHLFMPAASEETKPDTRASMSLGKRPYIRKPAKKRKLVDWKQPIARAQAIYQHKFNCSECGRTCNIETSSPKAPTRCGSDECEKSWRRNYMKQYRQRNRK